MDLGSHFFNLIVSLIDTIIPIIQTQHMVCLCIFLSLKQWQFVPCLHELSDILHVILGFLYSLLQIVNHITCLLDISPRT